LIALADSPNRSQHPLLKIYKIEDIIRFALKMVETNATESGVERSSRYQMIRGRSKSYVAIYLAILMALLACSKENPLDSGIPLAPVFYVEASNGTRLESSKADEPINPASVVKVATSLWAITELGPDYRFETQVAYRGKINVAEQSIEGDLLVFGSGDPDFHIENAYLLAREINRIGIRKIHGNLLVNSKFWIGWEGGSERREKDAIQRTINMAVRLRNALNPKLWSDGSLQSIVNFEKRRAFSADKRPGVIVLGTAGGMSANGVDPEIHPLFTHKSNSLVSILKRFNSFSNNDIERLGDTLGSATDLSVWLSKRWGEIGRGVSLETLSGLGINRLSPRQIVHLLNDLARACKNSGIFLADILPVAGCDPGTVKNYPRLRNFLRGNLTSKTGTLWQTDGGVSVLAGVLQTNKGQRIFCVATAKSGQHIPKARAQQEQWLIDLVQTNGGAPQGECGPRPIFSDNDVTFTRDDEVGLF